MRTDLIFYILAIFFFVCFMGVLIWYILDKKYGSQKRKTPISWTIESAKKFLEDNEAKIQAKNQIDNAENPESAETSKENSQPKVKRPPVVKKMPNNTSSNKPQIPVQNKPITQAKTNASDVKIEQEKPINAKTDIKKD